MKDLTKAQLTERLKDALAARDAAIAAANGLDCKCICHTGTCGKNAMVLAERTIRLMRELRPLDCRVIEKIEDLVHEAGVSFAYDAVDLPCSNDEVPF